MSELRTCDWYWGSHGCDLEPGHEGVHHCGGTDEDVDWESEEFPCSEYDGSTGNARNGHVGDDGTFAGWSEWMKNGYGFSLYADTPNPPK